MTALRILAMRVKAFVLGRRSDRDLDDDVRVHLDLLTDEYIRRGLSSEMRIPRRGARSAGPSR